MLSTIGDGGVQRPVAQRYFRLFLEDRVAMKTSNSLGIAALIVVAVSVLASLAPLGTADAEPQAADGSKADPAVLRARREVQLLDTIYKNAIVLITKHYVEEDSDLPAGQAFKVLFDTMEKDGWHQVRLLDGTGEALNDENKPRDEFERQAIKALLAEKTGYEQIETRDGKEYLRSATPLPVVMEKCVMCHENYRGKQVIGALSYTLPLEPHR
jgi:hypothetical protein